MVLVSIRPFALRKIFLVIVALLCFSVLCLADPLLMAQRYGTHSRHLPAPASRSEETQGFRPDVIDRSRLDSPEPLQTGEDAVEFVPADMQANDYLPEGLSAVSQRANCVFAG
jgi:hypothetical protein